MVWWYIYQNAKILWNFNNNTTLINVFFLIEKKLLQCIKKEINNSGPLVIWFVHGRTPYGILGEGGYEQSSSWRSLLVWSMKTQKIISASRFFFNWDSLHVWTATTRHGVTRKRNTKRLQHTGNLFRKNLKRCLLILHLKSLRS